MCKLKFFTLSLGKYTLQVELGDFFKIGIYNRVTYSWSEIFDSRIFN